MIEIQFKDLPVEIRVRIQHFTNKATPCNKLKVIRSNLGNQAKKLLNLIVYSAGSIQSYKRSDLHMKNNCKT